MVEHKPPVIRSDLRSLLPGFIEQRKRDVVNLTVAASTGDLTAARKIGHQLRGNGGSYGFDEVSVLGATIEAAAQSGNVSELERTTDALRAYVQLIEATNE